MIDKARPYYGLQTVCWTSWTLVVVRIALSPAWMVWKAFSFVLAFIRALLKPLTNTRLLTNKQNLRSPKLATVMKLDWLFISRSLARACGESHDLWDFSQSVLPDNPKKVNRHGNARSEWCLFCPVAPFIPGECWSETFSGLTRCAHDTSTPFVVLGEHDMAERWATWFCIEGAMIVFVVRYGLFNTEIWVPHSPDLRGLVSTGLCRSAVLVLMFPEMTKVLQPVPVTIVQFCSSVAWWWLEAVPCIPSWQR